MATGHGWLVRTVALAVCSAAVAVAVTGSTVAQRSLLVLQMNLCDSGIAGCYTGRAVQQANALVDARSPDVVTLNEACRDGVAAVAEAVRRSSPGSTVVSAFHPAPDRRTGLPTPCRNGQPFGVGLVLRSALPLEPVTYPGAYPVQDPDDPEERVWVCLVATGQFAACTTHLAINASIAAAQCAHLLGTVVPALPAPIALIGGDFNLRQDGRPGMRDCVPPGYVSRSDDGLQYVVATNGFAVRSAQRIDMAGATDHPALLVALYR